jgi:hypothetical protein
LLVGLIIGLPSLDDVLESLVSNLLLAILSNMVVVQHVVFPQYFKALVPLGIVGPKDYELELLYV